MDMWIHNTRTVGTIQRRQRKTPLEMILCTQEKYVPPLNLEVCCFLGVTFRESTSYKAVLDEPGRVHERHKLKGHSCLSYHIFVNCVGDNRKSSCLGDSFRSIYR